MAKCNRCGATLANSTSRALNIHRARYCLKSGRMKFVPLALRAPKHSSKGKEVQKQPNIDASQPTHVGYHTNDSEMDVELDTASVELPEFVEGSSNSPAIHLPTVAVEPVQLIEDNDNENVHYVITNSTFIIWNIQVLNQRYRSISTFGRSTIRKFSTDVSAMKKLAARDFEDLLQCAMACFITLFPNPCEKVIMDLLFMLATWHALAKLRMHSTSSLLFFDGTTKSLGQLLRRFHDHVCPKYNTQETPAETEKRNRRNAAKSTKTSKKKLEPDMKKTTRRKRNRRLFNLATYKNHALGHYPEWIRRFGTTDSYSTQTVWHLIHVSSNFLICLPGELEHRRIKRFYARTNHRAFQCQISRHERRTARLRAIKKRMATTDTSTVLQGDEDERLPHSDPSEHYHISNSHKVHFNITKWLVENKTDQAVTNFLPTLKDHLLGRIAETPEAGFTDRDRRQLLIHNNQIFCHKTLRVNFTTYDCRRDQDTINTRTHSDVMVLANQEEDNANQHPYWYARVVGIFHAMVSRVGSGSTYEQMDFLWVRWYGLDTAMRSGFKARRLHQIGFLDSNDDAGAFGFIDPHDVIRAVHLISAFQFGTTSRLLSPSMARREDENDEDYERYYINMFVDRDMFMRFCGLGPGHKATRHVTKVFRDEIAELFGGIADEDDTSEIPEGHEEEVGKEQGSEDESSSEDDEDSEESEEDHGGIDDDLDYATMEDDFGYAVL